MKTIHVMAPFHTIPSAAYSHCAFTGKALRFSKMMRPFGWRCVEYANAGSESEADEKVQILSTEEFKRFYQPETNSPGAQANVGSPGARLFNQRVEQELTQRAKVGDIVAHIWTAQDFLVPRFPGLIHVETGIGYPQDSIGNAYRVFESEAWRHYHWGRVGTPGGVLPGRFDLNPARTWVVPNYFDVDEWPVVQFEAREPTYVVFMARFVVDKGIDMLRRVIKLWTTRYPDHSLKFVLAGMGGYPQWYAESAFTPEEAARIDYRGVVTGTDRAALVGGARAMLLPSIFVEPFGGSAVEAMLTGTPAITPTFGAFTETIEDGVTGFRCRTVDDYVEAIMHTIRLDRLVVAEKARARFSLQACGKLYDEIFTTLTERASVE